LLVERSRPAGRIAWIGATLLCALSLGLPVGAQAAIGWSTPVAIDRDSPGTLAAVACPTVGQCTAVDSSGQQVTFDPSSPGAAKPTTLDPVMPGSDDSLNPAVRATNGDLTGVACPSASQCTASGGWGQEITFDPRAPGTPAPVEVDSETNAVACASAGQCTVVDSAGAEVTFDPLAPGTPTRYEIEYFAGLAYSLTAVACPSAHQCTAVDDGGNEVTFDPSSPGTAVGAQLTDTGARWLALACPSVSQCTTVDAAGLLATFDPSAPDLPPSVTTIDQGTTSPLTALACASATQCTAVDAAGTELTFDPTSPAAPATATVAASFRPLGLACPAAGECTAVGSDGAGVTFAPKTPGTPTPTLLDDTADARLLGLACRSAVQCTAVDDRGQQVTFDPLLPGDPAPIMIDPGTPLNGVACPPGGQLCTAVDAAGRAVTFDPVSASPPTPVTIDPSGHLTAVACPATGECVGVDDTGHEVTFDPSAPGSPIAVDIDGAHRLSAVACPSTGQCTAVDTVAGEVTFDPNAPGAPSQTILFGDGASTIGVLTGIACQSPTQCTAAESLGGEITFDPSPAATSAPSVITKAGGTGFDTSVSIACPSIAECVTTRENTGEENTFDPFYPSYYVGGPDPGATASMIDAYNSLNALACPSSGQCTAVDDYGDEVTGTGAIPPASVSPPTISGTPTAGQTLDVSHGIWSENPTSYTYYWERCAPAAVTCTEILFQDGPTYTLGSADVGYAIRVGEIAINAAGGDYLGARSPMTAVVSAGPPATGLGSGSTPPGDGGSTSGPDPRGSVPTGHAPRAIATVGRPTLAGSATAVARISCAGAAASSCTVRFSLSVVETLSGREVIAVAASTSAATGSAKRPARTRTRDVVIGGRTVVVSGGHAKLGRVVLDAAGKRLLAGRRRLRAEFTATDGRAVRRAGAVTFAAP
jgi:hypothetical protein